MNIKQELQNLNNRLDKYNRKMLAAKERGDEAIILQFQTEIDALTKSIASVKGLKARKLSGESANIKAMPFSRVLTKQEQADMGKLKKSVKGLVVVHPLTALGRELAVDKVTGFAHKAF